MMKHIDDIELIKYVAGNLAEAQAADVRGHIDTCPDCSQRIQEIRSLWDALGQWQVDSAGRDVAGRVTALAKEAQLQDMQQPATSARKTILLHQILRIAASIIIAVGLGHMLGEYSVTGKKPQIVSSQDKPEYLAALGLEWSSGLAWLVLEEEPADTEGEQ